MQQKPMCVSGILRNFAKEYGLNLQYKEVDGDHGQMVPMTLPDVFQFFNKFQ